jgi:hypothetical protein
MWDFSGGRTGGNRYLGLGLGTGQAADVTVPPDPAKLIAYGPLLSDDGATWAGYGDADPGAGPGHGQRRADLRPLP